MRKFFVTIALLLVCGAAVSAGVIAGKNGYSASVIIRDAGKADGRVLSKDGLFTMDIRNGRIYTVLGQIK